MINAPARIDHAGPEPALPKLGMDWAILIDFEPETLFRRRRRFHRFIVARKGRFFKNFSENGGIVNKKELNLEKCLVNMAHPLGKIELTLLRRAV